MYLVLTGSICTGYAVYLKKKFMAFSHNTEYLLGGIPMAKLIPIFNGSLYKLCSDAPNPLLQVRLTMIMQFVFNADFIPIPNHLEFNAVSSVTCIFFQTFKNKFLRFTGTIAFGIGQDISCQCL